jgi:TrmH family RNA methyltransferase
VITSPDNPDLKLIRRLQRKKARDETGMFAAEGEDLVEAAAAAGWQPELVLRAGEDVDPDLLARVSVLGSGSRVVGVYRQRFAQPGGRLSVYLHGVGDPGNVGTMIRSAHALCDGPVVLGPGCADPYGPKSVRASMGSVFARPPARADFTKLGASLLALDSRSPDSLAEVDLAPPLMICVGAERDGLPQPLLQSAAATASIPLRPDGPESLNAAMAATVALYDLVTRMPADA